MNWEARLAILERIGQAIQRERDEGCGAVYLIQAENGLYKIGSSRNPMKRLGTLQTGAPVEIELVHIIITWQHMHHSLERALHRRFAGRKVRGEWYALTPEDVAIIESMKEQPWTGGRL